MSYFASLSMKKELKPYTIFQSASAFLMILALLWLTISAPFIYEHQQKIAKQFHSSSAEIPVNNTDEESVPLGNATEEKAPGNSISLAEEYLHNNHHSDYFFSIASQFHKCENADTYIAFHGELLVPPPNFS